MRYLWVFLGGGLGSVLRMAVSGLVARGFGETFPWGTLVANVSGSLVIGFFATFTGTEGRWLISPSAREFVMIGILGGYTTFSSFSLQTLNLMHDGQWTRALLNVVLSVLLCLGSVWVGHVLASALGQMKGA